MKLSVVMPVFNEAGTARSAAEAVLALRTPFQIELIAVDDGSTDGTGAILSDLAAQGRIRLIRHGRNLGKGAAVRDGFKAASGDAVIIFDADLEYDAADIPAVASPVLEGKAPSCFGSRFARSAPAWGVYGLFNRFISLAANALLRRKLTDVETCMKCFSRRALESMTLRSDGFGIEPELLVGASAAGEIAEVPVSYRPRSRSEGKKIRLLDAFLTVLWLVAAKAAQQAWFALPKQPAE